MALSLPNPQKNPKMQIDFPTGARYVFTQPAGLAPATEVTVVDKARPETFKGAPFVLAYNGAHCVYHGFMTRRGSASAIPVEVAVKWVAGEERIKRLLWEAEIYETRLGEVQGVAVPRYYGYFNGQVNGVDVACIILEWCNGLPLDDAREMHRQRMLAAVKLHQAGVMHRRLVDPLHFLPMRDGTLRIVDFSDAKGHRCPGALPLTINTSGDERPAETCGELSAMESRFGVDAERLGRQLRWANGLYPEFVSGFYYSY